MGLESSFGFSRTGMSSRKLEIFVRSRKFCTVWIVHFYMVFSTPTNKITVIQTNIVKNKLHSKISKRVPRASHITPIDFL